MAVIKEEVYSQWKAGLSTSGIREKLGLVISELFGAPATGAPRGARLTVMIDKIVDEGVPGGRRAMWFREQMAGALLHRGGIEIVGPPRGWAGDGVPRGTAAVLSANVFKRRESQRKVLEVFWKARIPRRSNFEERSAAGVLIAEDVAPAKEDPALPALPQERSLSLRIDASSSGSLCPGQTTQLNLYSGEDRYVQVFDIYGPAQDRALLMFPNPARPDGRVRAGETIPIGPPKGFQAVPVRGSEVERFIVLAAPSRTEIGVTGKYTGECRLSSKDVAMLLAPAAASATIVRAGDGFRIARGPHCKDIAEPTPEELALMEKQLAEVPLCK